MPRDHARIHLDIWGNDSFREISPEAQHLYFVLYTWPPSFCGAGAWQPRKIAPRAQGWSVPKVLDAAEELVAGDFVLIDLDTEEFLMRSWIKHDGLYRVQNMAVSMANARGELASKTLRGVVVHEVLKLRKSEPALESWNKDAVAKMLEQNAIDPHDIEWSSPWASPSASPWVMGSASPKDAPEPSPSGSTRATPAPTPAPSSSSSREGPRTRGQRIPDGWKPSNEVIAEMRAECPHVALEAEHRKFVDYWTAKTGKDATKRDWNATWRNWIRRAAEQHTGRPTPNPSPGGHDTKVNDYLAYANTPHQPEIER